MAVPDYKGIWRVAGLYSGKPSWLPVHFLQWSLHAAIFFRVSIAKGVHTPKGSTMKWYNSHPAAINSIVLMSPQH